MDISKADKLKQHFSTRVTNQARQVLDLWRCLHDDQWQSARINDLLQANEKLLRFAQRFESDKYSKIAENLHSILSSIEDDALPSSEQLNLLNDLMLQLSQGVLRRSDSNKPDAMVVVKKPVYVALNDTDNAVQLAQQMEYFGLKAELFNSQEELNQAMHKRHPLAIIMDIDFQNTDNGLAIIKQHVGDEGSGPGVPVIFYSSHPMTLRHKLQCLRLGGVCSLSASWKL